MSDTTITRIKSFVRLLCRVLILVLLSACIIVEYMYLNTCTRTSTALRNFTSQIDKLASTVEFNTSSCSDIVASARVCDYLRSWKYVEIAVVKVGQEYESDVLGAASIIDQ